MIQKTLKLYMRPDSDEEDGFVYFVTDPAYGYSWTQDHDINIGDVDVSFNVPNDLTEDELRRKAIDTLKDKQDAIRAKAFRDIEALQNRIDEMLLLTHQSESVIASV